MKLIPRNSHQRRKGQKRLNHSRKKLIWFYINCDVNNDDDDDDDDADDKGAITGISVINSNKKTKKS